MEKGEIKNVYKVYDKIAPWFADNRSKTLFEKAYLDKLLDSVPDDAAILDLGCGIGVPILKYLVDNDRDVTGVDASSKMLEIAKANFPKIEFKLADMRLLNLGRKFDAIIAWHSFFHLPESDQPPMFKIFEDHLNPGGILLFTSGPQRGQAWGMNGGENLFHASLNPDEYEMLLIKHNFQILTHTSDDPGCGADNVWMAKYTPPE